MKATAALFAELSDNDLIDKVSELASRERRATAELVAALAEVERRKLYLPLGYPSLFVYCTRTLHLSEYAAYNRIEAARMSLRFPGIVDALEEGKLTLAAVRLLAPVLTPDNCGRLLKAAEHQSKRDVEVLVAAERPKPDVATSIRRLPTPAASSRAPSPSTPASVISVSPSAPPAASLLAERRIERACQPLTPERYKIQFTASRQFHDKLRRAQALLRHVIPTGDAASIFDRALDLLIAAAERQKIAATNQPRSPRAPAHSRPIHCRHIPAAVKREVWKRDNGRCAFVGVQGRCSEEGFLEFHHVVPFAEGGPATTANIELRCRAHNAYEADWVGKPMFPRPGHIA